MTQLQIFTLAANENWIVDRFHYEWLSRNEGIHSGLLTSNIIWLLAGWCWNSIPKHILSSKKVVCTIHHIDFDKFNNEEFITRDQFVDVYHVTCKRTYEQVSKLTNKPIIVLPFWVNDELWKKLDNKQQLKEKFNIPNDKFIIGSFQRDTEGHDLTTPKLSKGPDRFCEIVHKFSEIKNIHVLLSGWRREYVIRILNQHKIPFSYIERPKIEVINELYNIIDLYIVASRVEGGPQAIFECASTKTPIISSYVGYSDELLTKGLFHDVNDAIDSFNQIDENTLHENFHNVSKLFINNHMKNFIDMFKNV